MSLRKQSDGLHSVGLNKATALWGSAPAQTEERLNGYILGKHNEVLENNVLCASRSLSAKGKIPFSATWYLNAFTVMCCSNGQGKCRASTLKGLVTLCIISVEVHAFDMPHFDV